MSPENPPQTLVLRNTLLLVAAQVIALPLSVLVNAVIARTLGPSEFGHLYLATTFASLAVLFVEWGQGAVLTRSIARNPACAGVFLGSSIAWRTVAAILASLALIAVCVLLNYDRKFLGILTLVLLAAALGSISFACQDVLRGLERMAFGAASYVAWQMLTALVVVPTLLFGGQIYGLLWAQTACAGIGALYLLHSLRTSRLATLAIDRKVMRQLFAAGTPFLILALAMALQVNVDAFFLSKYASADAIGWYAVARKLIGLLIYPASALISALYPTLSRLHTTDSAAFADTSASALRAAIMVAVPISVGCALFPDIGVKIFNREFYGPAEDDLRLLAAYLFLVYFSMPIGTTLTAAGLQRPWAVTQFGCVLISALLDPMLISWFQRHDQNGGLGVCVSIVISEILMVTIGLWLLPTGIINKKLLRTLLPFLISGLVMALAGLTPLASFLAASVSIFAYAVCLWALGGLGREQVTSLIKAFSSSA